jgi:plastocyanin
VTRPGRLATTLTALVAALALSSCGGDDGGAGADSSPKKIEVSFDGESVTPNGDRIEVSTGQEIDLVITADEAGEIHVHSTPEQEFEYAAGESTLSFTVEQPGVVDVEAHGLDKVIVQLEVK